MHYGLRIAAAAAMTGFMLCYVTAQARAADPAMIAAAEKEGEITLYTSANLVELVRPLTEAFNKKYPKVKPVVVSGGAAELALKIINEGKAGRVLADVNTGGSSVIALKKASMLESYTPESAKDFPREYKDPAGLWTASALQFFVVAINTDLVKAQDTPKSYADLLDPKWRGKMVWTSVPVQGGPWGFFYLMLDSMGQQAGMDYLRKLSEQKIVNYPANARTVLDQVIAGAYPMGLMLPNSQVEYSKAQGAPITWVALDPAMALIDTMSLIKGSPHPNAGKLYIDFVASHEGQDVFRKADLIPIDQTMTPLHPEVRPDHGKFHALPMAPETYEAGIDQYNKIYADLFK